ncbi:quaternary amine ABC transporter ATP-binding protein [Saccharopolyspora sp. MS10]|uniref:quaternary amine ABC transporter ATP-binding protein n=1 Tax=Saccharopolyspora sp. MS10 TaxID=3385973 RepID=UPI0039A3680E
MRASGLSKVFGARPTSALRRARAGEPGTGDATVAVLDASFEVLSGELFVVMGLSGSGKSTLIRMLNGLLTPTEGRVLVGSEDVTALRGRALRELRQRRMSMVFQHFALLPHRSVLDNVEYGPRIQRLPPRQVAQRAAEALELVGLTGWERRYPRQLSGGMRQRVGLARALAAGTEVLLMDEAFSALDPLIKREVQDQLVRLQAELGKTIVFITHDLDEAVRLGDRIAVMREGRIVQLGTPSEIVRRPADDYVARFVRNVDRSRVLTAAAVAEPVLSAEADCAPERALRLLREGGADRLVVVDRERRPLGVLGLAAAERAGSAAGIAELAAALPAPVAGHRTLRELLTEVRPATPVLDDAGGLIGVLEPEAVLRALAGRAEAGDG